MLRFVRPAFAFLAFAVIVFPTQPASALIFGGEGNEPLHDPGWPAGAAAVFNTPSRVAYWEGPPLGGGQWHAECRGDAKAFNAVLHEFASVSTKSKKIIVHDGIGRSFWINPNREPDKADKAKIDWMFMVWVPANWERFGKVPGAIGRPADTDKETKEDLDSPAQIDVYTGGGIHWTDVVVPPGIEVFDDRLEVHGFTLADGTVLEGDVTDLEGKPIAARVELQLIEPKKTGGYDYKSADHTTANGNGHFVLTKVPKGWYQVVASADGYVPRVIGHATFDGQPGWHSYRGELSTPTTVSGLVADDSGKPLADVTVRLMDVLTHDSVYNSPGDFEVKTDAEGRFLFEQLPIAKTRVWVHKKGYCRPGLGEEITTPADKLELKMTPSAQVHVTVDFTNTKRPSGYVVHMSPEGGEVVGSWGGSGNINDKNEITFSDVPPGKYVLVGRPNPGSDKEQTAEIKLDLQGGATVEVPIIAK